MRVEARSDSWFEQVAGVAGYHTNSCVQIVTVGLRDVLSLKRCSAGTRAVAGLLPSLRHSSNRCTSTKTDGTNSTALDRGLSPPSCRLCSAHKTKPAPEGAGYPLP